MKKTAYWVGLIWLASAGPLRAQDWCGTDDYNNLLLKQNPEWENRFAEDQIKWRELSASAHFTGQIHTIPVVVHVLHDNGNGNITAAQVWDGIRVLNEDFRRLNADTADTRSVFKPFAADCEFQFKLAEKDPDGNCTSGIVRVNTPLSYDADNNVKALSYWPSDRYFNVWLVNSIAGGNQNSIILGYAQFPGWGSWDTYGVVIRNDQWGRTGTSTSDGRTASHELGHCLGLFHTFQDGCGTDCSSSGDNICDTPPVFQPTFSCNQSLNSCSNDADGPSPYTADVPDQIENYMSYDNCQNMFSKDQKNRMKTVINAYSQLQNLVSAANLSATGTDGNDMLCQADFTTPLTTVCAGETVTFYDESFHGQTSWQWSFPGASPAASNVQHPSVVYWEPGLHDVSLTVQDGQTSKSVVKTNYMLVLPGPGHYLPFTEDFENINLPGEEFLIYNPDNDHSWELTTNAAYHGSRSVMINNFNKPAGRKDELISSTYDMSNLMQATVSFKIAYAKTGPSNHDLLRFYVSGNCGNQWALRWQADSSKLPTVSGFYGNSFVPVDSTQWKEFKVYFNGSYLSEHTRFKFVFESGGGNNLYLDDVNLYGEFNPTPLLIAPPDGSAAEDENTLLDWKPVPGSDFYQYRLDTSLSFTSPLLQTGTKPFLSIIPDSSDSEFQTYALLHAQKYYWSVRSITGTDTSQWAPTWSFTVSPSGVGEDKLSRGSASFSIYPNPACEQLFVDVAVGKPQYMRIDLLNIMGQSVCNIQHGIIDKQAQYRIHTKGFPPGMYLIRFVSGTQYATRKIIFR